MSEDFVVFIECDFSELCVSAKGISHMGVFSAIPLCVRRGSLNFESFLKKEFLFVRGALTGGSER